ncbi:MAG: phosphotransferase [Myxococcales bacterium]|nr:phosphotransferase [Myxococcales bacterium]
MEPSDLQAPEAREQAVRACVREALGCEAGQIEWLPAALGARRFARVHLSAGAARTLIARVEAVEDPRGRPSGSDPEPPLEPIRALLERQGLPVPGRLGGDASGRVELLEDVGPRSLQTWAKGSTAAQRRGVYAQACDLVAALQRVRDPGGVQAFRRRLDAALFGYKAELFCRFSLAERDPPASDSECLAVREAFAHIAEIVGRVPARLAHRDFQSANLHVREDASGALRLVMIDLQGAFLAPPEYDLVCLLRDSYVELSESEVREQLERVRPTLPDAPEAETCQERFDLLTLSRKAKDHARFLQAAQQREDRRFLVHLPSTVRSLRRAARAARSRDSGFSALAEIVESLPESACER